MRIAVMLLGFWLACAAGLSPVLADKRALVVGVNAYPNLAPDMQLQRAVADAGAVGETLRGLGFEVTALTSGVTQRNFWKSFDAFRGEIAPGDTVLLFFAGHGAAIEGANFLIPGDIEAFLPGEEKSLTGRAIAELDVVEGLRAKAGVAIIVIDACRNNPFPKKPGQRAMGAERGLAPSQPPTGVFSLYSAGWGQTALDLLSPQDVSKNSVFTRIFIEELVKPVNLVDLGENVKERVATLALKQAQHEQVPANNNNILRARDLYLAGRPVAGVPGPADTEQADFATASLLGTVAGWDAFLAAHRSGALADYARGQREKLKTPPPQVAIVIPPPPVVTAPCGGVVLAGLSARAPGALSRNEACALKRGDEFRECKDCPPMVVVPPGSFTMGSPANEPGRFFDEGPQHVVRFARGFAVGKFAVTFAEWDACVAGGGCGGYRPADAGWGRVSRPVINVSWDDAQAYAAWLSKKTGATYRLLSEAEREYVARAGTSTPFWWGKSITPNQANYDRSSVYEGGGAKGASSKQTVPVDSFSANPWGLFNVHGNVWEWTQDCWNETYASASSDGLAFTAGDCSRRVLRGGSWSNGPGSLRAALRIRYDPAGRDYGYGFRLARTLLP